MVAGSRTATQVGFGIAVAALLTDNPFGTRESPFPRFPRPPRKAPDSARSAHVASSRYWFEKASRQHALSRYWKHLSRQRVLVCWYARCRFLDAEGPVRGNSVGAP